MRSRCKISHGFSRMATDLKFDLFYPCSSVKIRGVFLFSADTESHPRPEVRLEREISDHLVVAAVEYVLDIDVGGHVAVHVEPAAGVDQRVAGGVVDAKAEKVGIGTSTDKAAGHVTSPAAPEISQQSSCGVLGTTKQRAPRAVHLQVAKERRNARRGCQNLRGSVGITRIQRQLPPEPPTERDFRALSERFVDIDVLADEGCRIKRIVDAVVKEIVKVGCGERVPAG